MTTKTLHRKHHDAADGLNVPATTRESQTIRAQMESESAERIAKLEARYRKALVAAADGDAKAVKELGKLCGELGWTPEQVGADQAKLSQHKSALAIVAGWTDVKQQQHEANLQKRRDLHEENRLWPHTYDKRRAALMAESLPLDNEHARLVQARKEMAASRGDPLLAMVEGAQVAVRQRAG